MAADDQPVPDGAPPQDHHGAALVFGLLFLVVGLLFMVGSWGAYARDRALLDSGGRTLAQVTRLERVRDSGADGSTDHLVHYVFSAPQGITVRKQAGVDRDTWGGLQVGGVIEVVYDKDDPRKGFPIGGGVTSLGMVWLATVFGALFAMGGGSLLAVVAHRAHRRRIGKPATW